jgi:hypothetical protein
MKKELKRDKDDDLDFNLSYLLKNLANNVWLRYSQP